MVQQINNKIYRERHWANKAKNDTSEFAIYNGEDLVYVGTATECADYLGIKLPSFYMNMSPSHQARKVEEQDKVRPWIKNRTVVKLDDDEEEEE